jgi:hypothetical protein
MPDLLSRAVRFVTSRTASQVPAPLETGSNSLVCWIALFGWCGPLGIQVEAV